MSGSKNRSGISLMLVQLWCYLFFGALHELAHLVVLCAVTGASRIEVMMNLQVLAGAILGQYIVLEGYHDDVSAIVRHAGWITSMLLALVLQAVCKKRSFLTRAAWIIALEAVTMDLMAASYSSNYFSLWHLVLWKLWNNLVE